MITRYSTPEMISIWADESRFRYWLRVEKAVAKAEEKLGIIPEGLSECLRKVNDVDPERVAEIESVTEHEVTAFLQAVWEQAPCSREFLHFGLTSYDVVDTGLSLRIVQACAVIQKAVDEVISALRVLALKHKRTLILGRTHGQGAEPISFGVRVLSWYSEGVRVLEDFTYARNKAARGRISGTVGTFTILPPQVEEHALRELGLEPEPVSTQVIPRDRHATLLFSLSLIGTWLERMALNIRLGQLEGLGELAEPFRKKQTGSSAMPHKKNPVITERVCGLSRILRANVQSGLENIALWHERDISHSSVERVILADSFNLTHYLLGKMQKVISGLVVQAENMKRILDGTGGTFFAQRLLNALIRKGMSREEAYKLVQGIAFKVKESGESFDLLARKDDAVTERLNEGELNEVFDLEGFLDRIDLLYDRMDLTD
ncbi:adenylosuccinate lyase [candidate division WOR-3 bacterium]|nr:adenylosuccinate lyase [candidate division WOR-3 bacterium]